jgi:hypothetical protein
LRGLTPSVSTRPLRELAQLIEHQPFSVLDALNVSDAICFVIALRCAIDRPPPPSSDHQALSQSACFEEIDRFVRGHSR